MKDQNETLNSLKKEINEEMIKSFFDRYSFNNSSLNRERAEEFLNTILSNLINTYYSIDGVESFYLPKYFVENTFKDKLEIKYSLFKDMFLKAIDTNPAVIHISPKLKIEFYQKYDNPSKFCLMRELKKLNPKKQNISTNEENETKMKLPEQKGLRNTLLKMIFSNMEVEEVLSMGLVNKEWLSCSRDNFIWDHFFKKDFNFFLTKNVEKDLVIGSKMAKYTL
eukprot:TRINITY_DN2867_c0_g1_i5.p1 TRINITY_DN2867_c0_g1~~TRINITY_DN2867_c0_g1_i5.p1  ORF type:complete len:223 (+),score=46.77 TRINITY_DN2867_c0_g1_i5:1-669(+)